MIATDLIMRRHAAEGLVRPLKPGWFGRQQDKDPQAMAQAAVPNVDTDLHTRLKSQVETRAVICEQWLPLWRALLRYQSQSPELAMRIKRIRAAMRARLALVYGPELLTLPEAERTQLLVVLDILTDFESWGRMREDHGLSIEAARDLWIVAIGRLLPAAEASQSTRAGDRHDRHHQA